MKKNNNNTDPVITFRIPPDLKAKLERLARRDVRSLSNYLRLVLEQHIQEQREEAKAA